MKTRIDAVALLVCALPGLLMPGAFGQAEEAAQEVRELTDAGYASPTATLASFLWAMREFDSAKLAEALDAEAFPKVKLHTPAPLTEEERKKLAKERPRRGDLEGFRIVSSETSADGTITLTFYLTGKGYGEVANEAKLRSSEDAWKITEVLLREPRGGGVGDISAFPEGSPGLNPLLGIWLNADEATQGITRIEISVEDNKMIVRAWGSCSPFDCF